VRQDPVRIYQQRTIDHARQEFEKEEKNEINF